MENASRALVMAAGVFIAIAIISVALYAYSNAKGYASSNEALLSASQIQGFNRFYTAYGNSDGTFKEIKCIEAINILNRAVEDGILPQETSDKIESKIVSGKTVYVVAGGSTEFYTQKVDYAYARDAEGKVFGVTIKD